MKKTRYDMHWNETKNQLIFRGQTYYITNDMDYDMDNDMKF